MNQPGRYDIVLQKRADFSVDLQFKNALKEPINLTGYEALAQIWDSSRSTKYADFTIEYTDRSLGKIRLKLSYIQTTELPYSSMYDVMLISPTGERRYYVEGSVNAEEGYTRPAL